jgi:hypothetical protein
MRLHGVALTSRCRPREPVITRMPLATARVREHPESVRIAQSRAHLAGLGGLLTFLPRHVCMGHERARAQAHPPHDATASSTSRCVGEAHGRSARGRAYVPARRFARAHDLRQRARRSLRAARLVEVSLEELRNVITALTALVLAVGISAGHWFRERSIERRYRERMMAEAAERRRAEEARRAREEKPRMGFRP